MTVRPDEPTDRPDRRTGGTADLLSDVLRSIHLTGGVFLDARFTAPWSVTTRITAEDCRPFLAAPAQLIAYHVAVEGEFVIAVDHAAPITVRAGEIVLVPRNDAHVMASRFGLAPVNGRELLQPAANGGLARISHGGGGAPTRMVCGFLASEDVHTAVTAILPRVVKVDVREAAARDFIEASVRFAAGELAAGRPGSSDVMSRLSELLLVEAVRHYAATLADGEADWLKGLNDPQIGRALVAIHRDIAAPLSAERLAREAALSRTAFMDRFRQLVGVPPIRYLTVCRLQTARLQLRETARSTAQIAHAVGYESEEAFSRAFKREFGLSPARWRSRPDAAGGDSS